MSNVNTRRTSHVPALVKTFNRLTRSFAGRWLYALLRHRGRKSGKIFDTPVMAWRTPAGMLVPLTWGPRTDWYQNTLAAGFCEVQIGGRWQRCAEPALIDRPSALASLPPLTRAIVGLFPIRQFLLLRKVAGA